MCGRYFVDDNDLNISEIYNAVNEQQAYAPEQLSFNLSTGEIFPTNIVPVITGSNEYKAMKWGFAGYNGRPIINARSETAYQKPMFRNSIIERRCLIPASGYYEWQKIENKKQKYLFTSPENAVFYMLGCFKIEQGSLLPNFVILTRDATELIQVIHDRMPVIVTANAGDEWLSKGEGGYPQLVDEVNFVPV